MALTDVSTGTKERTAGAATPSASVYRRLTLNAKKNTSWLMVFSCLFLACIGASWFSFQYFLLSQPQSFTPTWGSAQWIQASDGSAPVVYFRSSPYLETLPSAVSVTVGASDAFRLFVNSTLIGGNESDYVVGDSRRAYTFDITSALQLGSNGIVIRATDPDNHTPAIKANVHFVLGSSSYDVGSGNTWKATSNSSLVFPRFSKTSSFTNIKQTTTSATTTDGPTTVTTTSGPTTTSTTSGPTTTSSTQTVGSDTTTTTSGQTATSGNTSTSSTSSKSTSTLSSTQTTPFTPWSAADFDVTTWPDATMTLNAPQLYTEPVTPFLYSYPLSNHWISSGAASQGYFVREISMTQPAKNYWLRFRAAGPSTIFVNGNLLTYWTGQPPSTLQSVYGSFSYVSTDVKTHSRYSVGVYDIAPYLHSGVNTIAVYVSAPNVDGFIGNIGAAMSVDMLVCDYAGNTVLSEESGAWHASSVFVAGWDQESTATLAWPTASQVPGTVDNQQFSIPGSNVVLKASSPLTGATMIPWPLLFEVIGGSILAVIGLWLLMALTLGKRYYAPWSRACSVMSVAFLPALAVEAVLITLSREPHITQPFPYNSLYAFILLGCVVAGYFLLWLNATLKRDDALVKAEQPGQGLLSTHGRTENRAAHARFSPLLWLRSYWPVLLLMIVGCVLILPTLSYEPLWQDELVSFYVAKQSVARGFPMMPTGFIYPKAELFHYMLGVIMLIFGDQLPVPRSLSAVEYIISIPLLYYVGSYFFDRRIALFATAILTLSPFALTWGAQLRMYEQAQVCVFLMIYVFHRAIQSPQSKRMPYIAIGTLLLTYLSHEETFIVLPALALCVCVFTKDKQRFLPSVFYQKHWWYASIAGIAVIVVQLLIVKFSHPPVLGTDQSMRPNVQFHEDGLPFYTGILFFPRSTAPWLVLNSILAMVACIWAIRSKDARLRYCALFFIVSLATLIAIFTMQADRYFYPLLTIYYLLGSYVVWKTLEYLWTFVASQLLSITVRPDGEKIAQGVVSPPLKVASIVVASHTCGCILLAPMLPISSYNLVVSRAFGLSYLHHFSDYDAAGSYVKSHWHDGDVVISMSPDIEMLYYLGRSDYFFSVDRALFLIERNGRAINTATGATAVLSQTDFSAMLAKYPRIWIVSDHSTYQNEISRHFTIPSDFHIVFEGARNAVYLRGS